MAQAAGPPRAPGLSLTAIVPSVERPQLEPYRSSGQLEALVAGPRAVASLAGAESTFDRHAAPLTFGMLIAIAMLLAMALGTLSR